MRLYVLLFLLTGCFSGYSQNSINNYKYVLVPERFTFLKQNDQYRLNSLAKSFLEEAGFTAYFDNTDLPAGLANNKCSALVAEITEKNSMFATKLTLSLKDCKGRVLFKSKEGVSREKEFEPSYRLALSDAFTSLKEAGYVYQPLPEASNQPPVAATASPAAPVVKAALPTTTPAAGTLYAQPIANGYQLIDMTPKTVLRMFLTSVSNYFIADNGSSNGIVFKKGESWVFEYYKDGKLMAETLLIKF